MYKVGMVVQRLSFDPEAPWSHILHLKNKVKAGFEYDHISFSFMDSEGYANVSDGSMTFTELKTNGYELSPLTPEKFKMLFTLYLLP